MEPLVEPASKIADGLGSRYECNITMATQVEIGGSMKISRDVVVSMSDKQLEGVLSLGRYHHMAVLLRIQTQDWMDNMKVKNNTTERHSIFVEFTRPYLEMFISMVFVVEEGLHELRVEDPKLDVIRAAGDINLLRRFRNGTFHFQYEYKSEKQTDLIYAKFSKKLGGLSWVDRLHQRHGVCVRALMRNVKYHPDAERII